MTGWRVPLVAAALLAGCGPPPPPAAPPVPVQGPRRDVRGLAGQWAGEFVNTPNGRRGTIAFALDPGRDTAHGWVVTEGVWLRLGRVVVADASVTGWLEPYRDFELGCPVDTWFEGRLVRDTLRGMFFAHPATGNTVRRGTWWAARRR
jgi:hypothetical protein